MACLCSFSRRGRMGVEPTGAGIADAHTVLKTGEATGPLPPPQICPFENGRRSLAHADHVSVEARPLSPRGPDLRQPGEDYAESVPLLRLRTGLGDESE